MRPSSILGLVICAALVTHTLSACGGDPEGKMIYPVDITKLFNGQMKGAELSASDDNSKFSFQDGEVSYQHRLTTRNRIECEVRGTGPLLVAFKVPEKKGEADLHWDLTNLSWYRPDSQYLFTFALEEIEILTSDPACNELNLDDLRGHLRNKTSYNVLQQAYKGLEIHPIALFSYSPEGLELSTYYDQTNKKLEPRKGHNYIAPKDEPAVNTEEVYGPQKPPVDVSNLSSEAP